MFKKLIIIFILCCIIVTGIVVWGNIEQHNPEMGYQERDQRNEGYLLAGAVFGLFDSDGNLIAEYITDENGEFATDGFLPREGYFIQEISPPPGFWLDDTRHYLNVDVDELYLELTTLEFDIYNQPIMGNIRILKRMGVEDKPDTWEYEVGAVFQIFCKSYGSFENAPEDRRDTIATEPAISADESNIGEATTGGTAGSKDLPYGIYIVRQIEGAPGFAFQDDFVVAIDRENIELEFELLNEPYDEPHIPDEPPSDTPPYVLPPPQTGDNRVSVWLYAGLMLSAIMFLGILMLKKNWIAK